MRKKIEIATLIQYGAVYKSDCEQYFYFSLDDYVIYERNEIKEIFGLQDDILDDTIKLFNDFRIIPIFQLNLTKEMRTFLENENNKKITKEIKELNEEEMYRYFRIISERDFLLGDRWGRYAEKCLVNAAIEWCKQYHLAYEI